MRLSHALLVLPLLAGCAEWQLSAPAASAAASDAPITTTAASYALRHADGGIATEVGIRFENESDRTMYIVNCRGLLAPVLEKRVDGAWVRYWSPALPRCLSAPIVIEPGAAIDERIQVWGAMPGMNWAPVWASAHVAGTYRIVLHSIVYDYDGDRQGFGEPVPLELRVSNEFTLTGP